MRSLTVEIVERRLIRPFTIASGTRTGVAAVAVGLHEDGATGRGETTGLHYRGETPAVVRETIEGARRAIEDGADREALRTLMAPGGARAALDAALWDLEAKTSGAPAWTRAGLNAPPAPVVTAFTIGLDAPDRMAEAAAAARGKPLLKVKLGGRDGRDAERAHAVRRGAPEATLIADANAAWTVEDLERDAPALAAAGYALLEQPLAIGADGPLEGYDAPLPLCADESFNAADDLEAACARYQAANIKLDKCGGLTEALELHAALRARGMKTFIGCMMGGALTVAPAFLLAQDADYVDLDGPLWIHPDHAEARLEWTPDARLAPPPAALWG